MRLNVMTGVKRTIQDGSEVWVPFTDMGKTVGGKIQPSHDSNTGGCDAFSCPSADPKQEVVV